MGDYNDYVMASADGTPVSGVCHARGANAGLPAQWLMYVNVEDIEASTAAVEKLGGALITPVKIAEGHGSYCVVQDPAGAVLALFQPE
jgi:predicted enzyme related to lactoylglutathione lyase